MQVEWLIVRFIVMGIVLCIIGILIVRFLVNKYASFVNVFLVCHEGESRIERFGHLYHTYFVLILLIGGAMYFTQMGFFLMAGPLPFYVYFFAAGFILLLSRIASTTDFLPKDRRQYSPALVNHIMALASLGSLIAIIRFCFLWITEPEEIYPLIFNISFSLTFYGSDLIAFFAFFLGYPAFLGSIVEALIFASSKRVYTKKVTKVD